MVVKVGTTLLTGGHDTLDRDYMATLAAQLIAARQAGWEVVLVTSGAIAAGRARLKLERGGKDISGKQMLAAVGQSLLMRDYDALFSPHGTTVAQTLLTKRDLRSRVGYLNARNTLLGLLDYGVLPIINENDVVAVDELVYRDGFGDNDTLSAMVANLVDAGLLLLLTDIEGLYTADPRCDPTASLVRDVQQVDKEIERLAGKVAPTKAREGCGPSSKRRASRQRAASPCRLRREKRPISCPGCWPASTWARASTRPPRGRRHAGAGYSRRWDTRRQSILTPER